MKMSDVLRASKQRAECRGNYLWPRLDELADLMAEFERVAGADYDRLFGNKRVGKKRDLLFEQGKRKAEFYFLFEGLARSYQLADGMEKTSNFFFGALFVDIYATMDARRVANFNIKLMEDSVYCAINRALLDELKQQYPILQSIEVLILKAQGVWQSEHKQLIENFSQKERLQFYLEQRPHYLQRIPQRHLATYLQMHESTLSELRKELLFEECVGVS